MKIQSLKNNKFLITIGAFAISLIFILRELFDGGVITHNFLAREDLPEISNWWGIVTIPLLTWTVIYLILKRSDRNVERNESKISIRFLGGLAFGITISALWEFDLESVLQYLILFPIVVSLFKPVHFPECLLGFVISMIFTFGGVLPIIIGTVLLILCWVANKVIRGGVMLLVSKL